MKIFVYEKVDIKNEEIKVDKKFNFFESFLDWLLMNKVNSKEIDLYTNLIARVPIVYIPEVVTGDKPIQYCSSYNTKIIDIILEYAKLDIIFKSVTFVDVMEFDTNVLVDREKLNQLLKYYDKLKFIDLWKQNILYIYDKNGFYKENLI